MLNLKKLLTKILQTITRTSATCTIASGWQNYSSGTANNPIVIKQGNVVHFSWVCKPTATTTLNTTLVKVCTIPSGYRPIRVVNTVCQGSGTSFFYMAIDIDGSVYIARYRDIGGANGTYYQGMTSYWYPLSATWVI